MPHFLRKGAVTRLVGHVDTLAMLGELPAMIHTAYTTGFVAAKVERGQTMGTILAQQADRPIGSPEGNQIFAQQAYTLDTAPGLELC
jgi:hypothetical protein